MSNCLTSLRRSAVGLFVGAAALPLFALLFSAGCTPNTSAARSRPSASPDSALATVASPSPSPSATPNVEAANNAPLRRIGSKDAPIASAGPPAPSETVLKKLLALPLTLPNKTAPKPAATAAKVENPGLVVCYPQTPNDSPEDLTDFAAACGLYVSVAAGKGPLGQSPLLTSVYRVREQLKYPGLHLDTKQGVLLAKTTGATHVAVGELTEKGMTATLTYRLHSLDNKPLGEPIVLTGTRDDLTKQLPGLAALIAFRLGAPLTKPQPLPPSGMEMTQLGSCVRAKPMKPEQEAFLARFATQNIAATVLNLSVGPARRNPVEFNRLVTALLITEPENPLIYGQIGYIGANALVPHKATFAIAAKKYPKNYALAHTSVWLARVENDTVAERQAAQRAVQNAPRNPDAYLTLGWTVAETAHQVRKGKTYGNMTPTEQTFVARVYPEWSKVVRRATELDPLYAKAWLRLAESATFNGNAADAVAAWETAEKTGCNPYDLYDWGLQMFQDKWGGSPARLRKVGEAAVKAQYNTIGEALDILANLQDAGLSDLAAQMGSDLLKQAQDAVQKQPNLAQAHYDLAQVYKATGDSLNAIAAYEKVAALRPNDADAQYDLGFALGEKGMNKQAAMALQEAIRRAPDHHRAYAMLAWTQKHMGDLLQAEAAAKKSVELRSDYAQGWAVLGTIYAYQKKDDACIAAYRKALALWPHFPEAYHNMHVIYARRNDWENDLKVLTQLALYRPENAGVFVNIAHCYQMKKDWKRSAEASREALAREENNPYAYANLGVALLHLGNKSEGKQACEQAIALAPEPQFAREVEAEMTKLLKPKKTTTN